jgi:tetratricopeptide (TPR) repeat protein
MTQDKKSGEENHQDEVTSISKPKLDLSAPLGQPEHFAEMEKLQIAVENDPKTLQFVQLGDLYLANGMIKEARELVEKSLKHHPKSLSGLILLGRICKFDRQYDQALEIFSIALKKAPSNWYALLLRAETYLKSNQNKLALKDFKQVLLNNPNHPLARKAVAKLEVLTADEFDDDVFEMKTLNDFNKDRQGPDGEPFKVLGAQKDVDQYETQWKPVSQKLERLLALVDAFTVRHDYEKAMNLLKDCKKEFGDHGEIQIRWMRLSPFEIAENIRPKNQSEKSNLREQNILQKKLNALELLLRRIEKSKKTYSHI